MSESFYKVTRLLARMVFACAARPRVLHRQRAALAGGYILAANHISAYDSALLVVSAPRTLYWLSILEIFQHPFARWFLTGMGALPLDRSRNDVGTLRALARHLKAGRVVGIFPEGQLRSGADSVLRGGHIRDGICKLAQLAGVPVVPCVVEGGGQFARWQSWLPFAGTRYGVAFGEPIYLAPEHGRAQAREAMVERIEGAFRALAQELEGGRQRGDSVQALE